MGEKVDTESARRAGEATSQMLTLLEGSRRKPSNNVIALALERKLKAPKTRRRLTLHAAE
jgi:hypothetical protein